MQGQGEEGERAIAVQGQRNWPGQLGLGNVGLLVTAQYLDGGPIEPLQRA